MSNSFDPDDRETSRFAASYLDPNCLKRTLCILVEETLIRVSNRLDYDQTLSNSVYDQESGKLIANIYTTLEEDRACSWFIGESTRNSVENTLSNHNNGTFVVYKPVDQSDLFVLGFKDYDTINFKDIYNRDGFFGFTEPLQFESLEDALFSHNNNEHSRFFGSFRETINRNRSTYQNRRDISNVAPASLLKQLRETAKLRTEKDEEICELQAKLKDKNEIFENLSTEISALNNVLKTLEKQTERHKNLEDKLNSTASEADRRDLSDNYQRISERKAQVQQDIERKEAEKSELESDLYNTMQTKHQCRVEVEQQLDELNNTKIDVLSIYPEFEEFMDNLLAEDSRNPFKAQPRKISKSEAKKILKHREEGTFVLWEYNKRDMPYCISISCQKDPMHFPILLRDGYYGFDETTCIFDSLYDLVMNYGKIPFRVHDESLGDLTLRYEWMP